MVASKPPTRVFSVADLLAESDALRLVQRLVERHPVSEAELKALEPRAAVAVGSLRKLLEQHQDLRQALGRLYFGDLTAPERVCDALEDLRAADAQTRAARLPIITAAELLRKQFEAKR